MRARLQQVHPNVLQAEKNAVYQSDGLAGNHTGYCGTKQGCDVDHVKDQLENFLHAQVCAGNIALDKAQQEIAKDWIASYKSRLSGH